MAKDVLVQRLAAAHAQLEAALMEHAAGRRRLRDHPGRPDQMWRGMRPRRFHRGPHGQTAAMTDRADHIAR
jgi:hypothetical protein